jgi:hypothetical protein
MTTNREGNSSNLLHDYKEIFQHLIESNLYVLYPSALVKCENPDVCAKMSKFLMQLRTIQDRKKRAKHKAEMYDWIEQLFKQDSFLAQWTKQYCIKRLQKKRKLLQEFYIDHI